MSHTPSVRLASVVEVERWNPWAELRARDEIEFGLANLPAKTGGGAYFPRDGWAGIAIDRSLGRTQRRVALAHELEHHQRGGGIDGEDLPDDGRHMKDREEATCNDNVARKFCPPGPLAELIASIVDDGRGVEAWEIAEAFDVTDEVAARALDLLKRGRL